MRQDYINWISTMRWDYIVTVRKHYKWTKNSIRRTIDKIGNDSVKDMFINRVFIVGERDVDDWSSFHLHFIIECNTYTDEDIKLITSRYFGDKDTLHIEKVIDKFAVSAYLNKFIDKDIEYDIY